MKISVVIPFGGNLLHLNETITSLQQQSFNNWECLIVNDSNVAISKIDELLKDDRFKIIQNKEQGAASARNIGCKNSSGDFVIFLDADDLLAPWALKERVNFMGSNSKHDFALFPALEFKHKVGDLETLRSSVISNNELENFLSFQTAFQTSCPIWRRGALEKIGGWNERAKSWQDGEFHIRGLLKGLQYAWGSELPDVFLRLIGEDKITSKAYDPYYIKNRYEIYDDIASQLPRSLIELFRSNITALTWNLIEKELSRTDINEVINYAIQRNLINPADQWTIKAYLKVWYLSREVPGLRGLIYRLRPFFKERREFFRKLELSSKKKSELLQNLRTYPTFYQEFVSYN